MIDAIKKTLTIDDGLSLESLAHQMLDLSSGNIVGQTIPTQGTRNVGTVGDVVVGRPRAVQHRIRQWLAAGAEPRTRDAVPPTSSVVRVRRIDERFAPASGESSPAPAAQLWPELPPAPRRRRACVMVRFAERPPVDR